MAILRATLATAAATAAGTVIGAMATDRIRAHRETQAAARWLQLQARAIRSINPMGEADAAEAVRRVAQDAGVEPDPPS